MNVEAFELSFRLLASASAREELLDRFLVEAIEANGLQFGGSSDQAGTWSGTAEPASGLKISASQRERVQEWLANQEQVCWHVVGAIVLDVPNNSFKPNPLRGSA